MTNEQYLFVSYALVGLVTLGLGWATGRYLRGGLAGTPERLRSTHLAPLLRRVFSPSFALLALAGFFSVSYRGCQSSTTYQEIIADRSRLVDTNYAQLGASVEYLSYGLLGWTLILVIGWCLSGKRAA